MPPTELAQESTEIQASCEDFTDQLNIAELQAEYEVPFDREQTSAEIAALMTWFDEQYGLEIEFMEHEYTSVSNYLMCPFVGTDLMKLAYLEELKKHVLKYPPSFLSKIGVHYVRFAERIYDLDAQPIDQAAGFVTEGSGYVNLIVVWPFNHEVFHKIDRYLGMGDCAPGLIGV